MENKLNKWKKLNMKNQDNNIEKEEKSKKKDFW